MRLFFWSRSLCREAVGLHGASFRDEGLWNRFPKWCPALLVYFLAWYSTWLAYVVGRLTAPPTVSLLPLFLSDAHPFSPLTVVFARHADSVEDQRIRHVRLLRGMIWYIHTVLGQIHRGMIWYIHTVLGQIHRPNRKPILSIAYLRGCTCDCPAFLRIYVVLCLCVYLYLQSTVHTVRLNDVASKVP